MPNIGYIYKTTNLINGKIYIGQHQRDEFDSKYYGSGKILLRALKKYGKENFKVEVVCWIRKFERLDIAERQFIKAFDSRNPKIGYNITQGGMSPTNVNKGIKFTEEHKRKISVSSIGKKGTRLGKHNTPEHNKKIRDAQIGKFIPFESRQKMAASHLGNHYPKISAARKGIASWNKGIPCPKETKKKIGLSMKGRQSWNKGIPCKEEVKEKIRTTLLKRNAELKNRKVI
jgi:group I intron endonuclease